MDQRLGFIVVLVGGILLFATVIVVLDWFGRRQQDRQRRSGN